MTPTLTDTSALHPRVIQLIGAAVGLVVLVAAATGCAGRDATPTSRPIDDAAVQSDRPTTQPTLGNPTAPPATAVPVVPSAAATPALLPSPELDAAIPSTPGPIPTPEHLPLYGTLESELMQLFLVDQERTLDDTLALAEHLGVQVGESQGGACFNIGLASRNINGIDQQDSLTATIVVEALVECVGLETLQEAFVQVNIFAANRRGSAVLPALDPTRSCDKAMPKTDARERSQFVDDLENVLLSVSPAPTSIAFGCRLAMQQTKEFGEVDMRCFSGAVAIKALPKQITTIVAELDQPCLWVVAYEGGGYRAVLHPDGFVGWVSAQELELSELRSETPRVELYGTETLCNIGSTALVVHAEPAVDADAIGEVQTGSCGLRWDGVSEQGWVWVTGYAEAVNPLDDALRNTLIETTGWVPKAQTAPVASVNSPEAVVSETGKLPTCSIDAADLHKARCAGSRWTWMRPSSTCSKRPGIGYWTDEYSLWTTFELEMDSDGHWVITNETSTGLAVLC